jgi:hypothetical protein
MTCRETTKTRRANLLGSQKNIRGAPDYLRVGETATVKAVIKVTAFEPGESRTGWVAPGAGSDPYPDTSIDSNPDNNNSGSTIKLISKQVMSCW